MVELVDWELVTKSRRTFVTEERLRNRLLYTPTTILMGRVPESEKTEEQVFFKSEPVKSIQHGKAYTEDGVFLLKNPSNEYAAFVKAMHDGIPVVFNWVIGKENLLSANLNEKEEISYLVERIVEQDLENRTLRLEDGRTVHVVWRNINRKMLKHLKKAAGYMDLMAFFPKEEIPFQPDVFQLSKNVWNLEKIIFYRDCMRDPQKFSILNEEVRNRKKKRA